MLCNIIDEKIIFLCIFNEVFHYMLNWFIIILILARIDANTDERANWNCIMLLCHCELRCNSLGFLALASRWLWLYVNICRYNVGSIIHHPLSACFCNLRCLAKVNIENFANLSGEKISNFDMAVKNREFRETVVEKNR